MFLILSLLAYPHKNNRYEYLETYDMFGEEYANAIKKTNERYEKAVEEAESADTRAEYNAHMSLANHEFIENTIQIVKNCTNENNTMCKTTYYETINHGNIIVATLICIMPIITLLILIKSK